LGRRGVRIGLREGSPIRVIRSRRFRWAGHVARMEEGRRAFIILAGKPTGKKLLGRPMHRWEDNIIMNLKKISRLSIRGNGLIRLSIGITGEPL
jgi:hypothetical protein